MIFSYCCHVLCPPACTNECAWLPLSLFTWTLYLPLLCHQPLFHSLCFSTSLLGCFHLSYSFKMLPSLHASVLHPPTHTITHTNTHSISALSLQLSAGPFLPALPSADHVLITPQRNTLPPHTVHLSWCSPLCPISVRHCFALTSFYFAPVTPSTSHCLSQCYHSSFIKPAALPLFLPKTSHLIAVGSKCREAGAETTISSPCRSLSLYQLIGINLHPRTLLLLLFFFLSYRFCYFNSPVSFYSHTAPTIITVWKTAHLSILMWLLC